MRRITTRETLHGTRDGQLAIDETLAERFVLTERESACAALLKQGRSTQEIAQRLSVSTSTAEKHLVSLRRKLGASTTLEAVVKLFELENDATSRIPEVFGVVLPFANDGTGSGRPSGRTDSREALVSKLREADSIEEMLERVRDDLEADRVAALFYSFLPMAAASFRKGDLLQRHCASKLLRGALRADGGKTMGRVATRLFAEPDRDVILELDRSTPEGVTPVVAEACQRTGLRGGIALGSPFGTG